MKVYKENYKIGEQLYSNSLACSRISLIEDNNGTQFAVKEIFKNKLRNNFVQEFAKNELCLHYSLSKLSRSIVKIDNYYEDEERYTMVMEYSYDPEYFVDLLENVSFLFKQQRITGIENEGLLRLFAYDILSAIKVLHLNGVIHCDIKPQNFLIFKQDDNEDVKYEN